MKMRNYFGKDRIMFELLIREYNGISTYPYSVENADDCYTDDQSTLVD